MPGYILHLTSARMFLDRLPAESPYRSDPQMRNDFYIGSLLPDAVSPKNASHFYDPEFCDRMIVWPRPEVFLEKYRERMPDPVCLGYYYHLYIDKKFLKEYLPGVAEYYDRSGRRAQRKREVSEVRLKRSGERIPRDRYLSEEYYYGDYTKMNTYLCERYQLPENLRADREPAIEEVRGADLEAVFEMMREYRKVPAEAVRDVRVFDVEDLLDFLEEAAENMVSVLQGIVE